MMTGYGMTLGGFLMILFWVGVIAFAIWLVSALFSKTSTTPPAQPSADRNESALMILNQRFARGELSKEQYEEMRHVLEH